MKNKVLSIIVAIALTISVLAITTSSVSAAGKPNLSIANVSGGQRISWSSTGAQKYYLYFGVYDYNSRKATGDIRVPDSVAGGKCEITTTTGDISLRIAPKA